MKTDKKKSKPKRKTKPKSKPNPKSKKETSEMEALEAFFMTKSKKKSKPTSKTETSEIPKPLPANVAPANVAPANVANKVDGWKVGRVDPVYLMKEQEQWENLQTELKEAKKELDWEAYRLSDECAITVEKSKKNKITLSPELKTLIVRYKIADKMYTELVTKDNNYRGVGNLPCVNLSRLGAVKLGVLRCVCPECNHTEGLSIIIDGRISIDKGHH